MNKNIGCALIFLAFVIFSIANAVSAKPELIFVVILAIGCIIFLVRALKRRQIANSAETHAEHAAMLESLAERLPLDISSTLTLNSGESLIYKLNSVGLTEYVSDGSTYSGGTQGIGIRITKGLTYNVGSSRGSLTRNPEARRVIDTGVAYFTNQRIVFAGPKQSREWLFSKMLNADVEGNGVNVSIAVSNRQKTSGLTWTDHTDLTPGVLLAIAIDYSEGGLAQAKARCLNTAKGFRAISQGTLAAEATAIANPEANQ
jgi:hypothetical protein